MEPSQAKGKPYLPKKVTTNYCALIQTTTGTLMESFGVIVDSDIITQDYFQLRYNTPGFIKVLYCERLIFGLQTIFIKLSCNSVIKDTLLITEDMSFADVYQHVNTKHGESIILGIGKI